MTNMMKDYYKILEISEYSDFSEIKTAYRKLARKWHPDIAGNTSDVIKRFKDINEAYSLLSNPVKKADYDKALKFYNYSSTNTASKTQYNTKNSTNPNNAKSYSEKKEEKKEKSSFSFSWEDFMKRSFSETQSKKTNGAHPPKRGQDINTEIEITITEAIEGTVKVINMLQTQVCQKCGGRKFINGSICPNCSGSGSKSTYRKFNVKIPAGIKDGSKIRLAGEGERGIFGGANGDMYLIVHIKSPLDYTIQGNNVYKTLYITPYEAVLGANVPVKTLTENVTVKISPNTQSGQKIKLNGCGVQNGNEKGDMILTVNIQIPKTLSEEEVELYKKLQKLSSAIR